MTMPKGGARSRSGPPPDPTALRRERDAGDWVILPPEGRSGPAPAWPLLDQDDREAALWAELWTTPQALMWDRNGSRYEVALYVRRLTEAEQRGAQVTLGTLVRQMADSLGLTSPGMRANRWKVERPGGEHQAAADGTPAAPARLSARDRLKVIGGSG